MRNLLILLMLSGVLTVHAQQAIDKKVKQEMSTILKDTTRLSNDSTEKQAVKKAKGQVKGEAVSVKKEVQDTRKKTKENLQYLFGKSKSTARDTVPSATIDSLAYEDDLLDEDSVPHRVAPKAPVATAPAPGKQQYNPAKEASNEAALLQRNTMGVGKQVQKDAKIIFKQPPMVKTNHGYVRQKGMLVNDAEKDVKDLEKKATSLVQSSENNGKADTHKTLQEPGRGLKSGKAALKNNGGQEKAALKKEVTDNSVGEAKALGNDLKQEGRNTKTDVLQEKQALRQEVPDSSDLRGLSQQMHRRILEDKMSQMQYSSDDPENAPWKKNMFSKDDLSGLDKPSLPGSFSGANGQGKLSSYEDKAKAIGEGNLSKDKLPGSGSPDGVTSKFKGSPVMRMADSVRLLSGKANLDGLREGLLGAKKVYS
ncbi:MAG TPA: hypothetical protein VHL10_05545, partial [Nitrososphaera sp.]|nr:hypothetical protein [Nitrososphaera sp.]